MAKPLPTVKDDERYVKRTRYERGTGRARRIRMRLSDGKDDPFGGTGVSLPAKVHAPDDLRTVAPHP